MLVKQFTEMRNPQTWDLAEHEDIIITRKGKNEQRVLINFKTYEKLKKTFFWLQEQISQENETEDNIDWSLYIQDFKDILNSGRFKKVGDNYFENRARRLMSGE